MDFSLSEEQQLIKESVEKFIEKDYGFEARNKLLAKDDRFSRDLWKQYAELGWLGIALPEEFGGYGGGAVETMLVMEPFGSAMVLEPYLSTVVLGANAVLFAGSDEQKKALLSQVVAGELMLSLAYAEQGSGYALEDVQTKATAAGDGYRLDGEKVVVFNAPSADKFIVSARTSGNRMDEAGISLFVVDAGAEGVELRDYNTMDGGRAANLRLTHAPAELLGGEGEGFEVLDRVIDTATAALCAQALGAMNSAFQKTLEYIKTREQFGVPIGSFQVLQFRAVDMFMAVEASRSMVYMVNMEVANEDVAARRKAVSAAKAYVGKYARAVAQDAVQMHGGVGMTEELDIGHYFRYLTLFCQTFGDTDHHLKRYAQLL
ncbi:MAG: acyl-CoA dehydrogenase family protein [Pseudomonadota bacterium]|nr:acyl-CoA dehydrogenase family protein [Pseudomonadota bacterium]